MLPTASLYGLRWTTGAAASQRRVHASLFRFRSSCTASTATTDSYRDRRARISTYLFYLSHSADLIPEPWKGWKSRGARAAKCFKSSSLSASRPVRFLRARRTRCFLFGLALCQAGNPKASAYNAKAPNNTSVMAKPTTDNRPSEPLMCCVVCVVCGAGVWCTVCVDVWLCVCCCG